MRGVRWKVACINWSHADAPKASAYAMSGDEMIFDAYFPTWSEAFSFALDAADKWRRAGR